MYKVKSICVQCGSSAGNVESYKEQAYRMGEMLASESIRLIYGGSNIGLMGAVARGCLENGGEVVAIIPEKIKNMVAMLDVSELIVVQTMHERKAKMNELADAFIAMPGGFGTLEELFEVLTWNQLHYLSKPVALYNIENYYKTLWQSLNYKQRDILHLCSEFSFIWPRNAFPIILGDIGSEPSLKAVLHLLYQGKSGVRPFHESLVVFVKKQEEHNARVSALIEKVCIWLEEDASEYLNQTEIYILPLAKEVNSNFVIELTDLIAKRRSFCE